MKTRKLIISLLLVAVILPAAAQKRRPVRKVQPVAQPVVVEETPAEKLYKAMLPATAKVMFIDSIIVDKADFMKHIPLCKESGTLTTYDQFFNRKTQLPLGVYQNEFGDRCYYADGDTLSSAIYSIDRLGNQWSQPRLLTELGSDYQKQNYPFLMSDGITLFFSAKGGNSIGGYDIFMTLYDTENGTFYRPENYGLPFNSTANDYLLAIDESNELGWLVSDRYQPEEKVCIYTFVPTFPRRSLESENIADEQLSRLAKLYSISDTWIFGNRNEALARYQVLLKHSAPKTYTPEFSFIINDNTVYHQLHDFQSPQSRQLYQQLETLTQSVEADRKTLSLQRDKYANASARDQRLMEQSMLRLEHQIAENELQVPKLQKEIRYIENRLLNHQ